MNSYIMDQPARYQIRVTGRLKDNWMNYFEDIAVTTEISSSQQVSTTLTGEFKDQTAIYGALDKLYLLGLSLLSVEKKS